MAILAHKPRSLGYEHLNDEELRHWHTYYRRRLALVEQDVAAEYPDLPPDELAAMIRSAADFYRCHVEACEHEEARRARAAQLGVPRDADHYAPAFLADLKQRVDLGGLLEYELGARLGKANRRGERRGPCPLCKPSDRSDCLVVHLADPADQWWYCHRCGLTGDAIDAISAAYGLPFRQAVALLAEKGGIPLPEAPQTTQAPRSHLRVREVRYVS